MVAVVVASSAGHMLKMAAGVSGSSWEVAVGIDEVLVKGAPVPARCLRPGARLARSLGQG